MRRHELEYLPDINFHAVILESGIAENHAQRPTNHKHCAEVFGDLATFFKTGGQIVVSPELCEIMYFTISGRSAQRVDKSEVLGGIGGMLTTD
jgi:hypothetical protein